MHCPCHRVDYKGQPVIVDSGLGLEIENAPLDHGFAVVGQTTGRHDSTWKPVCGERAEVRDHCNQVVIARREGHQWFIGCMNGPEPHTFDVPLSFLDAARQYVAHIYSDDPAVPTRTHVKVEHRPVNSQTVLSVALPARGGQAIHISQTTDH